MTSILDEYAMQDTAMGKKINLSTNKYKYPIQQKSDKTTW